MTKFLNDLFSFFFDGANQILLLLPQSPFTFERVQGLEVFMGYLNYFVPVGKMVTTAMAWLVCVGLWYVGSIALRWAKAIE